MTWLLTWLLTWLWPDCDLTVTWLSKHLKRPFSLCPLFLKASEQTIAHILWKIEHVPSTIKHALRGPWTITHGQKNVIYNTYAKGHGACITADRTFLMVHGVLSIAHRTCPIDHRTSPCDMRSQDPGHRLVKPASTGRQALSQSFILRLKTN